MPKIHHREKLVKSAEKLILDALSEVVKLELTEWEYLRVCQTVLGGEISNACKLGIREERHGNIDTPGGFES
jgi:hypothetical protein